MSDTRATAPLLGGVALLERAVNYTLGSLHLVTAEAMAYRTPCREWDLRALLRHMNDSLTALYEAAEVGHVDIREAAGDPEVDPVATLKQRACRLLGAWSSADGQQELISIAGCPLTAGIVTSAGALEVAVHGWDVSQACGADRPIPASLAEEMLELTPFFVTDADRPVRFAAPVAVSPLAEPGDRLVAFLGRDPG